MRLWLTCMECHKVLGNSPLACYPTDIVEDSLYEFTCLKGHQNKFRLQGIKYQFLFESAFNALIEGYYLEAVLGFTSSLERFYEFYCKFVCSKAGLENDEFMKTWKQVLNQSERQFGAFIFLYATEQKTSFDEKRFKIPEQKNFRNKVIHKGYLPSEAETVDYGENVFNMIKVVSVEIAQKDHEYYHRFSGGELAPHLEVDRDDPTVIPTGMGSILGMTYDPSRLLEKDFRKEYETRKVNLLEIKKMALLEEHIKAIRKNAKPPTPA